MAGSRAVHSGNGFGHLGSALFFAYAIDRTSCGLQVHPPIGMKGPVSHVRDIARSGVSREIISRHAERRRSEPLHPRLAPEMNTWLQVNVGAGWP